MEDLESVLLKVQKSFEKKPLTRRFIVVEGLYFNHGDVCPLPRLVSRMAAYSNVKNTSAWHCFMPGDRLLLVVFDVIFSFLQVELKDRFKYRLIVDESMSIGCLGADGKGVSDHFGINVKEVDMITGSLGHAFGSCGGFCAGSTAVIDHQRLSGQAYCFSASLPALLAVYALNAVRLLHRQEKTVMENLSNIKRNTLALRKHIEPHLGPLFSVKSRSMESPILHIVANESVFENRERENIPTILQDVVDEAKENAGILLTRAKYVEKDEAAQPLPSIRIYISGAFSAQEVDDISSGLRISFEKIVKKFLQ